MTPKVSRSRKRFDQYLFHRPRDVTVGVASGRILRGERAGPGLVSAAHRTGKDRQRTFFHKGRVWLRVAPQGLDQCALPHVDLLCDWTVGQAEGLLGIVLDGFIVVLDHVADGLHAKAQPMAAVALRDDGVPAVLLPQVVEKHQVRVGRDRLAAAMGNLHGHAGENDQVTADRPGIMEMRRVRRGIKRPDSDQVARKN